MYEMYVKFRQCQRDVSHRMFDGKSAEKFEIRIAVNHPSERFNAVGVFSAIVCSIVVY